MTAGRDRWLHELDVSDDPATCPCEPMDSEDLLFLMYTSGHHGEAEGDRPHDRRLPRRRRRDAPLHLRPEAGDRRLLVRRRHRLDHRAQLHRLRAALQRGTTSVLYEGTPDFPDHARWWSIVERYGVTILYTAPDRHPRAHEVGPRARGEARPLLAPAPRLGRRADQPRGVDLVLTSTSAAAAAPSSTRGGRPRRG